ncbi:MAG TPA: CvpA family protein [Verrucomicrobiae bacterium]|nr:CvpA family protein [Verrucomicrobiae bacterium]
MIAATIQSLSNNGLPFNWFDVAVLVLLGFGVFRGRKNGMTRELAPTVQWVTVVLVAGLVYPYLADCYVHQCAIRSKLWSALLAYLSIAIVFFLAFIPLKDALKKRAENGGIFGGSEYYFGMCTGPIRYAFMILFALALLNARSYTAAEIAAKKAYNERWYGGGLYSGDYMPDLHTAQTSVFKDSFLGPYIQNNLSVLLVQSGAGNSTTGGGPSTAPNGAKAPQAQIHIGK